MVVQNCSDTCPTLIVSFSAPGRVPSDAVVLSSAETPSALRRLRRPRMLKVDFGQRRGVSPSDTLNRAEPTLLTAYCPTTGRRISATKLTDFLRHRDAAVLSPSPIAETPGTSNKHRFGRVDSTTMPTRRSHFRQRYPRRISPECRLQSATRTATGGRRSWPAWSPAQRVGQRSKRPTSLFGIAGPLKTPATMLRSRVSTDTILTRRDFSARNFNNSIQSHEKRIHKPGACRSCDCSGPCCHVGADRKQSCIRSG